MSRTERNFPLCHAGEDYAAKFGRDGQYATRVLTGHRSGMYYAPCLCCSSVISTPQAKRNATKMRRAFEKRDTRAQAIALTGKAIPLQL